MSVVPLPLLYISANVASCICVLVQYDRASQLSDPACATFATLLSSLAELAPEPEVSSKILQISQLF